MKKEKPQKTRITLDVSEQFNNRLERLQSIVEADSKSSLIRQALQVYEYLAKRTKEGYTFKLVKNGQEKDLVLLGPDVGSSSETEESEEFVGPSTR